MNRKPTKTLGTSDVVVAGVALVVAASTLVTDFNGYLGMGAAFAISLVLGFLVNLFLAISAAELSVQFPKAGAIYSYAKAIFPGHGGVFIGTFLGLGFYGMYPFAVAGETVSGALGMQAIFGRDLSLNVFVILIMVAAALPAVFGTRAAAWVSAGLLLFMLGIRWFFGIAGFFGIGQERQWEFANLMDGVNLFNFHGENGILTVGLALAIWGFVGIEFACSLAEEVPNPKKSMPKGFIGGLIAILLTSLIMGLGVTGIMPLSEWNTLVQGELGQYGEAPQLAVGQIMFGRMGHLLMAVASVTATLGTLTIAFATMPRIIYAIAKDGYLLGPLSPVFGKLHPVFLTPVNAIAMTFLIYSTIALSSSVVVDWILSAAYVWILIYIGFHFLALFSRLNGRNDVGAFPRVVVLCNAVVGAISTVVALYYAFIGEHAYYGSRAGIVLSVAFLLAAISYFLHRNAPSEKTDANSEI